MLHNTRPFDTCSLITSHLLLTALLAWAYSIAEAPRVVEARNAGSVCSPSMNEPEKNTKPFAFHLPRPGAPPSAAWQMAPTPPVTGQRAAAVPVAIAVTCLAVGLISSKAFASYLHSLLAFSHVMRQPHQLEADVIVVLGYALHRNGTMTYPLKSRVETGIAAFREGRGRHMIFSGAHPGGGVRGGTSEANAMSAYASQLLEQPEPNGGSSSSSSSRSGSGSRTTNKSVSSALPVADRWLLEQDSTSTRENALFSCDIVAKRGWTSILLVTNPFHQLRSALVFRKVLRDAARAAGAQQVKLYVAPAPFAPHNGYGHPLLDAAVDQLDFWRELAALAYYWARGWVLWADFVGAFRQYYHRAAASSE